MRLVLLMAIASMVGCLEPRVSGPVKTGGLADAAPSDTPVLSLKDGLVADEGAKPDAISKDLPAVLDAAQDTADVQITQPDATFDGTQQPDSAPDVAIDVEVDVAGDAATCVPMTCDDGNLCTTDTCVAGVCSHAANTLPCDADGSVCTQNDMCLNTNCVAGPLKVCDDGNVCTTDACVAATGACKFDGPTFNGKACDADGSVCTANDACQDGACKTGPVLNCDDGKACTTDSCDAVKGCQHANNTAPCEDGSLCTIGDACSGGVCVGGPAPSCDDGNGCSTDSCVSGAGCLHVAAGDGAPCAGGNFCVGTACTLIGVPAGMVLVPAGTFWMGCNSTKDAWCNDNTPQHKVALSAYYMDLTETTVGQYKACVTAGACGVPSQVQPAQYATYPGLASNPVNNVSWVQSQQYCKWRGTGYDLPTEAQWEMAARGRCEENGSTAGDPGCAATMRTFPWGETTVSCGYAVMTTQAAGMGCGLNGTWPVGSKLPGDSPSGLHDMSGNVAEWVRDWHGSYSDGDQADPAGPATGSARVLRGGGFAYPGTDAIFAALHLRAARRDQYTPDASLATIGLRCVRSFP